MNEYSSTGDQSENCWLNIKYLKCEIDNNILVITLAETYQAGNTIHLILDSAFDLPQTNGYTVDGFAVISSYNGITVDVDSLITFSNSQRLLVQLAPYETFSGALNPLVINPETEGELSLYSFYFTINTTITPEDSILLSFPYEFDAYLGIPANKFQWGDPNSYYLNCSSFTLSTIRCRVDH